MGRTLPSATQLMHQEEAALARFRRALRRGDQLVFDDLFTAAQKHISAAAYAAHALPFETFLMAMLVEEHKEVMRLRRSLRRLRRCMPEFTGWLLDLFEDPREGLVLYFIDEQGPRWRLWRPFPVTFYALGEDAQLRALWQHLSDASSARSPSAGPAAWTSSNGVR
jgi:hypothetical protein